MSSQQKEPRFRVAMLALLLLLSTTHLQAAGNGSQAAADAYRIGPEDVLEIVVWKNQEISRTVPVRPDGMISLPLVNDVQAAGLTPLELRGVLIESLQDYIPHAEVSVIVSQVNSPRVSVLGETTVGRYVLRSRTTVLDLIAQAGGLGEFAKHSKIVILRHQGDTVKRLYFNYKKALAVNGNGNANGDVENITLEPGDIILVPKSAF